MGPGTWMKGLMEALIKWIPGAPASDRGCGHRAQVHSLHFPMCKMGTVRIVTLKGP